MRHPDPASAPLFAAHGKAALPGIILTISLYAALTATVLWPIFSVRIPGLGDYLNHLARIHILTTLDTSPALQKFYEMRWGFAPYLGMDVVVSLLSHIMPLYAAGRVFMAICVLMPVIGIVSLHAAAYRRIGLVPAAGFLLSYNYLLSWGFLDYMFSAGLAVLLFAGWIATQQWRSGPRCLVFAAGLLIVYFSHVLGCALYCIMVAGFEIARACRARFRPPANIALNWIFAAAQSIPVALFAVNFRLGEAAPGDMMTRYGDVATKIRATLSPLLFPGAELSMAFTVVFSAIALFLLLRSRKLVFHPALWPPALAMAVLAACVPSVIFGLWGYDFRLPLVAAMLFLGALATNGRLGRAEKALLLAGLISLTVAKAMQARATLGAIDGQIEQVRQVLTHLLPGQRLLVIELDDPAAPQRLVPYAMTIHLPMTAIIDRDAFVPNLFTGLNLVHFRDSMVMSSSPNAPPIGMVQLRDGLAHSDIPHAPRFFNFGARIYWYGWPDKFDDVLILHFGESTGDLPANLRRIASSSIADLYTITPQAKKP